MEPLPLWGKFRTEFLSKHKNNRVFQSWFEAIELLNWEETPQALTCTLKTPSPLHKKWAQENISEELANSLINLYKKPCKICFEVIASSLKLPYSKGQNEIQGLERKENLFFNQEYTFDSFIVGKHNEFAYEACQALATKKRGFNPLFICGPSGLGKTHLLHAIGQKLQKSQAKIHYLSAERFLNEYVQSIRNKKMSEFQKKYRQEASVLLMDDIQMIAKGSSVQEEFFHTFNELYHKNTPVVVCCDKFPGQIPGLEERIKTRLSGGLVVDISYPDMETRLAILKDKADKKNLILSDQALTKIAKICKKSIREMEGVLNKIKMMGDLLGGALSLKHIEQILDTVTPSEVTVEDIQRCVAEKFNLDVEELKSKSRTKNIVTARQTAMYIIKIYLKKSLSDIGRMFGGKDHTTVLSSLKKIENLKSTDMDFKRLLSTLCKEINNSTDTR